MNTYNKGEAFTLFYMAFDQTNQVWIQEDASLHTLRLLRDGVYSLPVSTPQAVTHGSIPNLKSHSLLISASEADCDALTVEGESSTEGVVLIPWVGQASNIYADALLKRDWSEITGEASRSVLNALRFLRNKWTTSGSTLSVSKEDDSTEAWSATLSSSADAQKVTGLDPE